MIKLRNVLKFYFILGSVILSACSFNVSISSITSPDDFQNIQKERLEPDFISGEAVTTTGGTPGYQVKAVFGEISEKTLSLNGNQWQIEGIFYE